MRKVLKRLKHNAVAVLDYEGHHKFKTSNRKLCSFRNGDPDANAAFEICGRDANDVVQNL